MVMLRMNHYFSPGEVSRLRKKLSAEATPLGKKIVCRGHHYFSPGEVSRLGK